MDITSLIFSEPFIEDVFLLSAHSKVSLKHQIPARTSASQPYFESQAAFRYFGTTTESRCLPVFRDYHTEARHQSFSLLLPYIKM